MKKSKSRRIKTLIIQHKIEQKKRFQTLTDTMDFVDKLIEESRK